MKIEILLKKRKIINKQVTNSNAEIIEFTKEEFEQIGKYIKEHAEEFKYFSKTMGEDKLVTDDQASIGMSKNMLNSK